MNEPGATTRREGLDHVVQFYDDDRALGVAVARYLGEGLAASEAVVVIASRAHGETFQAELESLGFDVAGACGSGQLSFLDADETLAKILRDGRPDRERFEREIGRLVPVGPGARRLRAYGEMVDLLWQRGERSAALELEALWNELQDRQAFSLFCAYAMAGFYKEPAALHRVCTAHTRVVDDDADARNTREMARRDEVERALRDTLRELRRKEEALRASEEQLRDFLENATVGLHRVGPDGTILWANRAELELLGYTEAEYIGRPIADFHVDEHAITDILARLFRGEELHDHEARLRARDGSIKHVLISSSAYTRDGKFVHTRCFTRDITARRKAEEALHDARRRLELITDSLPVLVAYIDRDQRYRLVNASYERWFGVSRHDIVGKRIDELLGPEAYRGVEPHVVRALAGQVVTYEARLPYRHGGTRWVEATYIPHHADDGSVAGYIGLVADVTERKSFEAFRVAAAERAERLLTITAAIADAVSSEQVYEALVDRVAAALGASTAALWLVDDEERTARLVRSIGYGDATREQFKAIPLDATPTIPAIDCIRDGSPVWITSQEELVARYPNLRSAITRPRPYRVSCLPIIAQGRVLGSLGISIDGDLAPREDEHDFLQLIARYAGQAVERLRLFEAERRSRAEASAAALRLGVLSRASRAFVETNLDLPSRLGGVVAELGTALDGCVGIALLTGDGRLRTSAVYHPDPAAQAQLGALGEIAPLRVGEGITGSVAATGKSILIPAIDPAEMAARAAPAYAEFLRRFPCYAMACAPLRVAGRLIGTVTATRVRPGETYGDDDLRLLEELADRAAAAIENSRLYDETLAARTRAEQLYAFANAVAVADRVEQVFDAALAAIEAALGTNRAAILTYDGGDVMRFRAWRNLSETYRAAVEGHSPWTRDTVAPEPVLVPDASRDPALSAYAPLFAQEGIAALAFIPLATREGLLGKFMIYYPAPHAFGAHEVETAMAIANHLGSVITRFTAVAKLQETIRYSELFTGVLAHDLRNPLAAIMTAAQLVLMRREGESARDDRDAKPLSRILSSGHRMTRMIDQLLDFTRARIGGGIQVHRRDANLAELCAQAVGELELSYPEWRIQREVVGDPHGSWDPDRLLQVVSNLVANAGHHGRAGGRIVVEIDGTRPDRVHLRVCNEGAIPPALLPHVFDPFRGAHHRGDRSRGLGLGLFIVREIVSAHGGTVDVSSVDAATTFSIDLPRNP